MNNHVLTFGEKTTATRAWPEKFYRLQTKKRSRTAPLHHQLVIGEIWMHWRGLIRVSHGLTTMAACE